MPFERANIIQIRPNVHLIDDAGESTCYLITGSEKAFAAGELTREDMEKCASRVVRMIWKMKEASGI